MKNNLITLNFGGVEYGSTLDEDMFFSWLNKISSVSKLEGRGNNLFVYVESDNISDHDLRELISLCDRYRLPAKQLKPFLYNKNRDWFFDRSQFWYEKIFGEEKPLHKA